MRFVVGLVLATGCGFHISGGSSAGMDADPIAADTQELDAPLDSPVMTIDAPIDAAMMVDASLCGVLPGSSINVSLTTGWETSSNGTTWAPVTLPSTNWPCDNCTRYFRTTVCGQPQSVDFKFASDNRARMRVNGTLAYSEYWISGYCTDQPCCSRCCDSTANCNANLSAQKSLDAQGLALFTATTTNTVTWEVQEEVGGSGFTTQMTISY